MTKFPPLIDPPVWSEQDHLDIQMAHRILERTSFATQLVNLLGAPIEKGLEMLPDKANGVIVSATDKALRAALEVALLTLEKDRISTSSNLIHKFATATTGGIGGAFGWASLPVELPISTTIMLRSIADVARSQGEDLRNAEARLACIEVFALGNKSKSGKKESSDASYLAIRGLLAQRVTEAAQYAAQNGVLDVGSPALTRFIAKVAERFSLTVTEKAAAIMVPAIGAVGGAIVNTYFTGFYQDLALGHFIMRRLERQFGPDVVQAEYRELAKSKDSAKLIEDR
ncbi:EcsC family protein [Cerasicoccus arenae]|uniref:Peptidase n=1 Tax=Cerasicoccus arenae TaxID=424488 RepID=A0A8J3DLM9_9BACT|nr:EcsC family protein [Cerasicoccus arenae]MBK1858919.1 EcsC family protein [Cerasicoccus arenae]GHC08195.1 peptidase [Cerasicoccus arenae]